MSLRTILIFLGLLGIWMSRSLFADVEMSHTPSPQTPPSEAPAKGDKAQSFASLERKFLKAQRAEFEYAQKLQQNEIRDLKSAQSVAYKEWTKKEAEDRHQYFKANTKGQDRRAYIHDFQERRKIFFKVQKDDMAQKKHDHQVRLDSYRQDHESKLREFREYTKRGETPPDFLWPQATP